MWKKLEAWFEGYARYRTASLAIAELSRLSDKELKDIGMTRGQIREYALHGNRKSSW